MSDGIGARHRKIFSTAARAVLKQHGEVRRLLGFGGYEQKFLSSKFGNNTVDLEAVRV
jgi:hypothetical protein